MLRTALRMIGGALIGALMLPVAGLAQVSENTKRVTNFTHQEVQALLSEMGINSQIGENGEIFATTPAGYKFFVFVTACDSPGFNCRGLELFSFYDVGAGNASIVKANTFNASYPFAKAYAMNQGGMALSRYLTADDGIARGNIAVNIVVYLRMAEKYGEYIYNGTLSMAEIPSSDAEVAKDGFAGSVSGSDLPAHMSFAGNGIRSSSEIGNAPN